MERHDYCGERYKQKWRENPPFFGVQSAQIFAAHGTEFGKAAEVGGDGKLSLDRAEVS